MYVPTKGDDTAHHRPAGRQFAATGLPFLTQTIVDQGIGHRNLNFIQLILAAQLMLVFSRTLIEVIRRCILLHISTARQRVAHLGFPLQADAAAHEVL